MGEMSVLDRLLDPDNLEFVTVQQAIGDLVGWKPAERLERKPSNEALRYPGKTTTAYQRIMRGSLTEVYAELSQKFPAFVEVITEVRRRCDFAGADIVRLYEQWVQTRDAWIERKLKALGVLVEPVGTLQ